MSLAGDLVDAIDALEAAYRRIIEHGYLENHGHRGAELPGREQGCDACRIVDRMRDTLRRLERDVPP